MTEIKTVAVIGLGYIGLPTAAILATKGTTVVGVDVNPNTVDAVNRGEVPFVEPDLGQHVAKAVAEGTLKASLETPQADAYIVAVPTPFNDDKSADLSYIEAAGTNIAPQLRGDELIILESTSPPGATQHLADHILALRPDLSLDNLLVAHCPERVLPGRVMIELVTNDRIVGGITPEAAWAARDLYQRFCEGEILLTDAVTAEMAKLVENSFRDVNIAFANELSVISDKLGINVWELIKLANHHPRVNILQPGPGVGGHCIAVDPWFIVAAAPEEAKLIRQARETNDAKPEWVIAQVSKEEDSTAPIAVFGLAFKADIDDLRESPAVHIAADLADQYTERTILAVEPHIEALPKQLANRRNIELASIEDALERAGTVLILVDHSQFKALETTAFDGKHVVDSRGLLNRA
ncbi:UDP-N-acetyl-D-mannosamine dehydrogenase [Zhihengliuella sp.]|uniref:UDP-N-acetyl-D-mannosamine dehydrogenase n=1 Tax=Zhihengliuella sp. TaxID=1954483 RepID=UPI002810C528|nr:UDP-N-acetyl-D-mannosamine dehydrogenase [Zhihengliuella sp.]